MDPKGFFAPFGPTTAEQRHPGFRVSYEGHNCQWNGPSWPYATAQTLTALANVLNNYEQDTIDKADYFGTLKIYAKSHAFRQIPPGAPPSKVIICEEKPWIDENLNPFTGDWLARTRMEVQGHNHKFKERGKAYNHSTFCDLIITGLVGLRPRADDVVEVNPLLPAKTWDYFCLDNVLYRGRILTIVWDKDGSRYGKGKGLRVLADGREIASATALQRVERELSPGTLKAPTIHPAPYKTWKGYRMENRLVRLHPHLPGPIGETGVGGQERDFLSAHNYKKFDASRRPLIPSGLLGPVTLTPMKED